LYRYFMSQSSQYCRHNPLCCFSTSVYCCSCWFRYRLSPETSGYTPVHRSNTWKCTGHIRTEPLSPGGYLLYRKVTKLGKEGPTLPLTPWVPGVKRPRR